MSGIRLECDYHIVYGQATTARNIARCVERAGLFVEGLVLQPLASSYAVLSDEEKEAGVCLIDIGGGTTDIAIFQEDIIRHTCVIPFGGNVVTEDISQGLGIMRKYAEKLKRNFGMAVASEADPNEFIEIQGMQNKAPKDISRQTLAAIIEARMFEIIGLAWKEIQRVRYHDKLIGGIVVTGGGAELHGIQHLIEAITGVDTRVGYPTEHLSNGMVPEVNHPLYATGIGLAIYGLRNSFNFSRVPASFSNITAEKEKKTAKVETVSNARPAGIWQNIKNWFEKSINSASQAID
jgi:cell division protein FtsA